VSAMWPVLLRWMRAGRLWDLFFLSRPPARIEYAWSSASSEEWREWLDEEDDGPHPFHPKQCESVGVQVDALPSTMRLVMAVEDQNRRAVQVLKEGEFIQGEE
jgi:hypothetical protein